MNCINCGNVLPPTKRMDAVYCSDRCGNTYRGRRTYYKPDQIKKNKERREALRDFEIERQMLYRARSRAKSLKVPCDLELSDIVVPEVCSVLGIELTYRGGKGRGFHPNSPSLDRKKPDLGYTKGNVRVISARANLLKNDATVEELELVLADLKELK